MRGHQSPDTSDTKLHLVMHDLAIAAAAVIGLGLQPAQAQQNAGRVSAAVTAPLQNYCQQVGGPACGIDGLAQAQLAPDKFVAIGSTSLSGAQQQIDAVKDRLEIVRSESGAPVAAQAAAPGSAQAAATLRGGGTEGGEVNAAGGIGLFIRAEGQRDKSDATDFDPAYKRRATSFTLGADYRVHPDAVVGLSVGSRSSRSSMDREGTSSGKLQDRGSSVAVYGSWYPTQQFYVDAIAQFGRSRYDLRRDLPDISDVATGETSSKERSFSIGAGYAVPQGRWNFGPHARLNYSKVSIDGFTEDRNATNSALTVAGRSFTSLVSGLGAQVSYAWSQSWGVLVPNVDLEWKHQFRQDKVRSIVGTFSATGSDGVPIAISTTPVDKNYFTLDLGLAAHLGQGRSAILNYSTVLGRSGQSSNVVTAELRLEF